MNVSSMSVFYFTESCFKTARFSRKQSSKELTQEHFQTSRWVPGK